METKEKTPDMPKKCFCARCFLPIDADDKVDIEGQNFHRICSMCCICRNVPKSLKTFYGHVFCTECFKTHVLSRFRGEQKFQSSSWWTPSGGEKRKGRRTSETGEVDEARAGDAPDEPKDQKDEASKKQICARCLQTIPLDQHVAIGGQAFHQPCARCYCCHTVPTNSVKIYYGQVFCEECFSRFVINRDKDNPTEFYKSCFDNWNNSPQFAEHMRDFMSSGKSTTSPMVFMMQGQQGPFCRCSGSETQQPPEAKKCKPGAVPEPLRAAGLALGTGDAYSPPLDWRNHRPRLGSASLLPDGAPHEVALWHETSLRHTSRNTASPPRRCQDILEDVAQRFVEAALRHDSITLLDDSESSESGTGSPRSKECQSPFQHDSVEYESPPCERTLPRHSNTSSPPHSNIASVKRCTLSPRLGVSPRRRVASPKHSIGSPRHSNALPRRGNRSPRCDRPVQGPKEDQSLLVDNGSSSYDVGSLKSENGSLQHEPSSLGVSAASSMIPLFQRSLESSRNTSPRRFLRIHEKKPFAATSAPTGEDTEGWDLLSTRTGATGTETNSVGNDSTNLDEIVDVAELEKIEKLTQYLHRANHKNRNKNWKMFYDKRSTPESKKVVSERGDESSWSEGQPLVTGWVDIQLRRNRSELECPKCLWQSGIFAANNGLVSKLLMSSGSSYFE